MEFVWLLYANTGKDQQVCSIHKTEEGAKKEMEFMKDAFKGTLAGNYEWYIVKRNLRK